MNALLTAAASLDGQWAHHGHWFPLIPLLFIAVWIVVIVSVRQRWRDGHHRSGEAVLAERYARGEIDQSEYLERRSVLRRKD